MKKGQFPRIKIYNKINQEIKHTKHTMTFWDRQCKGTFKVVAKNKEVTLTIKKRVEKLFSQYRYLQHPKKRTSLSSAWKKQYSHIKDLHIVIIQSDLSAGRKGWFFLGVQKVSTRSSTWCQGSFAQWTVLGCPEYHPWGSKTLPLAFTPNPILVFWISRPSLK